MKPRISVVIPNHNGKDTIGKCLDAAFSSDYPDFEVVVVDDGSSDGSEEVIKGFPCKFVRLGERSGASKARNEGAKAASGDALFFIDSDCVMEKQTLSTAAASFSDDAVTGGTYTPLSHDGGFFSDFQSLFINHFETKSITPDYIATHAMLISRGLFMESGGFPERFLPIIEDVEFSHRLRRKGVKLLMNPEIRVGHIFGFSLFGSLRNAFRKSRYWTVYSIRNKDLLRDSGTASLELKLNAMAWLAFVCLTALYALSGKPGLLALALSAMAVNFYISRGFFGSIWKNTGPAFFAGALLYYSLLYPAAVLAGGLTGALKAIRR